MSATPLYRITWSNGTGDHSRVECNTCLQATRATITCNAQRSTPTIERAGHGECSECAARRELDASFDRRSDS